MDASTFYSLLFGSEDFEEYIGELQLAAIMTMAAGAEDGNDISMKHLNHKQLGREVRPSTLASLSSAICRPWTV